MNLKEVSNEEIQKAIDSWIHSERDRIILKLRLIDGYGYQKISDYLYEKYEIEIGARQVGNRISASEQQLFKHLK